jgi:hypothetical protein
MAKAKPYPNRVYPTTAVLKAMSEEEYAEHWDKICAEIAIANGWTPLDNDED